MTKKDSYHHGNLRSALIKAGLEILESDGLERFSLRACAEKAGVSHTAPKNHFGNLTGLLSALAAEGFGLLLGDMRAPEAATPADLRMAAFEGYVSFAKAHPALFELMFARRLVDFSDPVLAGPMSEAAAVLRACSKGMIWDKSEEADSDLRAEMLNWCLVHGFAHLSVQGMFDKEKMRHLGIADILPGFAFEGDP